MFSLIPGFQFNFCKIFKVFFNFTFELAQNQPKFYIFSHRPSSPTTANGKMHGWGFKTSFFVKFWRNCEHKMWHCKFCCQKPRFLFNEMLGVLFFTPKIMLIAPLMKRFREKHVKVSRRLLSITFQNDSFFSSDKTLRTVLQQI